MVHTIGSPRTLKDVFDDHRAARAVFERRDHCVVLRICLLVDCLDTSRIVDVRDRRDLRAFDVEFVDPEQFVFLFGHLKTVLGPHIGNHQHIRTVVVDLEPVGDILAQHGWCERAETLAVLHLEVE